MVGHTLIFLLSVGMFFNHQWASFQDSNQLGGIQEIPRFIPSFPSKSMGFKHVPTCSGARLARKALLPRQVRRTCGPAFRRMSGRSALTQNIRAARTPPPPPPVATPDGAREAPKKGKGRRFFGLHVLLEVSLHRKEEPPLNWIKHWVWGLPRYVRNLAPTRQAEPLRIARPWLGSEVHPQQELGARLPADGAPGWPVFRKESPAVSPKPRMTVFSRGFMKWLPVFSRSPDHSCGLLVKCTLVGQDGLRRNAAGLGPAGWPL